jgi:regulation of enolase protein 1 (concanavalin A-like superfamily)
MNTLLPSNRQEAAAVVYMPPDEVVLAGAMCAAPEGDGFDVTFADVAVGRPSA